MRSIIIVSLVFLLGCATPPFTPTAENKFVVLKIIIDKDIDKCGKEATGCSVCTSPGICTLYLPSIKWLDDENWYIWGKELGHAYYDNYHKGVADIY